MSLIDGKRLPADVCKLDAERMSWGWYSDHDFNNLPADVVREKIHGTWYDMAKIGCQAHRNLHVQRVVY